MPGTNDRKPYVKPTLTRLTPAGDGWTEPLGKMGVDRCKDVAGKVDGRIWTTCLEDVLPDRIPGNGNVYLAHWAPTRSSLRRAQGGDRSRFYDEDVAARIALRSLARTQRSFDERSKRCWTGRAPMPEAEEAAALDVENARLGELVVVQNLNDQRKTKYLVSFNGLYSEDDKHVELPDHATALKLKELIERHGDQRIAAEAADVAPSDCKEHVPIIDPKHGVRYCKRCGIGLGAQPSVPTAGTCDHMPIHNKLECGRWTCDRCGVKLRFEEDKP